MSARSLLLCCLLAACDVSRDTPRVEDVDLARTRPMGAPLPPDPDPR